MLLAPHREGIAVNTGVGVPGVVLPRLDEVKVGSLALGEAVLAVKLKLSGDNRVLTPAVHVKSGLGEDESTSVSDGGLDSSGVGTSHTITPRIGDTTGIVIHIKGGTVNKESVADESSGVGSNGGISSVSGDGVGKGVNGVGVVERLGAESLPESLGGTIEGSTVINVGVRLDDPDKFLTRVVEVQLDLVGSGSNGLVASELELLDEVLVRVLGHAPSLIGIKEDVVNVEGGGDQGLVVGSGNFFTTGSRLGDGPEALVEGPEVEVDLDLVVLEGNEGKGKSRVGAEPELEGNVEGGLRESVSRGAGLVLDTSAGTRTIDIGKVRVGEVGELGGVANHLVVATLLLLGEGELIPDVHPVSVLSVDSLSSNLNLNLVDELLSREVEPPGVDTLTCTRTRVLEALADLRESDLEVSPVGEITVPADGTGDPATEVSLTVESLLYGLHRKVGVSTVGHLPESDLGVAGKVDVLSAVSHELH